MSQGQNNLRKTVFSELSEIIKNVSGIDTDQVDADSHFLELGLDSLMLVRINQGVQKHFGVEMSMVQFYEDTDTINKIADYLTRQLPAGWGEPVETGDLKLETGDLKMGTQGTDSLERIMFQQMQAMSQLMTQQLEVLKGTNIKHPASSIQHQTSNIKHPASNIKHQTSNINQ